jgi:hypothetical protein
MATVSEIAALRGNYGDQLLTVTFSCLQGNATAATVDGPRGTMSGVTFAAPLAKGDLVKLSTACTWSVIKCAADDNSVLGVLVSDPVSSLNVTETQANQITNKNLSTGVIQVWGVMIREVVLESGNAALAIGNYLKTGATTVNRFDKKASGSNMTLALADAAANSGDTVPALFGWYGDLT